MSNAIGTTPLQPCQWCGGFHSAACPRIKAIEYHPDGTVKRVELHDPIEYANWIPEPFAGLPYKDQPK